MGCLFRKKWRSKKTGELVEGSTWWIKYSMRGKPFYESTHSTREAVAKKLLRLREGEISKGEVPGINFEKILFDDLADDLLTDCRINKKRTLNRATCLVDHLKEKFEGMKVVNIGTATIKAYIEKRMQDGLSNATINRELSALKRMFSLASQCTPPKIRQAPYIPMLKESNTRKGFFEYAEYLALKDALPSYLRPVVTFAYHTGWRLGEIVGLTWNKVDLKEGIIRLDPGETKNDEARTIHLDLELLKEMKALHSNRRLGCRYVFHREAKKDDEGNPIVVKDKKGNEETVKVPTRIFHDFRRTAIRNMVRANVSERVAMMVSGHKTRSVFERYNIVSDQDLREAARKMQTYHEKLNGGVEIQESKPGEVVQFKEAQHG